MKTVTLGFEEATSLAREILAEVGEDYVYLHAEENCRYFEDEGENIGEPSCYAGRILAKKGLTLDDLANVRNPDSWTTIGINRLASVNALKRVGILDIDQKTEIFLDRLQWRQDIGETWGSAYWFAISAVDAHMANQLAAGNSDVS
jgi:hypothetical protein